MCKYEDTTGAPGTGYCQQSGNDIKSITEGYSDFINHLTPIQINFVGMVPPLPMGAPFGDDKGRMRVLPALH